MNKRLTNIDTSFLSFFKTAKKLDLKGNICINDKCLSRVSQVEFLRTIIHDKLTWKSHIDYLYQKLSKAIAIVYSLKAYFTQEAICGLYYCPCHPYTTYCNVVWGNTFKPPDTKIHGANFGPTWGLQDSDGPHVGHTNLALRAHLIYSMLLVTTRVWVKVSINQNRKW